MSRSASLLYASILVAALQSTAFSPSSALAQDFGAGSIFERMKPTLAPSPLVSPETSPAAQASPQESAAEVPQNVFAVPEDAMPPLEVPTAPEHQATTVAASPELTPTPLSLINIAAVPDTGDKELDLLYLQVTMEETSFRERRDMKSLSALVSARERAVARVCMPRLLKTLTYKGPPPGVLGERCIAEIDKVLALDLENPIAICARDGIESKSCQQASQFQRIASTSVGSWLENLPGQAPSPGEVDLEAKLAVESNRGRIEALNNKLDQMLGMATPGPGMTQTASNVDPQSAEMQKLYSQLLTLSCQSVRVQLTSPEAGVPPRNQIEALERSLATPTPLPADFGLKPGRYFRLRHVSEECVQAIQRVKTLDPIHAGPACHEWGYYSPQCVEGIRLARMRASGAFNKPKATPSALPTSHLAEF